MSTKGDPGAQGRIVTKVVISYHTADDPTERTLTLEHGGKGEMVDAIVWGEELIGKLAYLEGENCVEPKKGRGTGDWKVYSGAQETETQSTQQSLTTAEESGTRTDCVWIHDPDCLWWEYCAS